MDHSKADCRAFLARLYLYLDGEIDDEQRADIDRHLEVCSGCEHQFLFERDIKALIHKKCQEQPSEVVIERLRLEIRRRI